MFVFSNIDAFARVCDSGSVPRAILDSPVRWQLDSSGTLRILPEPGTSRELIFSVVEQGGRYFIEAPSPEMVSAASWWEVIPLVPTPLSATRTTGRIMVEGLGRHMPTLIREMTRLALGTFARPSESATRLHYQFQWVTDPSVDHEEEAIARVWVSGLSKAAAALLFDSATEAGTKRFVEQSPGVWVSAGYRYPIPFPVAEGKMVLLSPPRTWQWITPFESVAQDPEWPPIYALDPRQLRTGVAEAPGTMTIPLQLVRSRTPGVARLWAYHQNAVAELSDFLRKIDQKLLTRLSAAACVLEGKPYVLMLTRGSKEPPPLLVEAGIGYEPVRMALNLFVPTGYRLNPALNRAALRSLLKLHPQQLTWLRLLADGSWQAESIATSAFRPLAEWVQYRIPAEATRYQAWSEGNDWAPLRFEILPDVEPIPAPEPIPEPISEPFFPRSPVLPVPTPAPPPRKGWFARAVGWFRGAREGPVEPPAKDEAPPAIPIEQAVETALQVTPSAPLSQSERITKSSDRGKKIEERFLADPAELSSEERLKCWQELGAVYAQHNNHADSALCWLNAVWEEPRPLWAWGWLRAESLATRWNPHEGNLLQGLQQVASVPRARALAAYVVWGSIQSPIPRVLLGNLDTIQSYLETHESGLPIRAAWLAKMAIARLSRGDVLGLARTRDRLVQRLRQGGVHLDIDLPAFLRLSEAGVSDRFQKVRVWLLEKRNLIHSWCMNQIQESSPAPDNAISLRKYGLERNSQATLGYADLMLAWGLTKVHHPDAGQIAETALESFTERDVVHDLLIEGFQYRIGLAKKGQESEAAFPPEWQACVEALPLVERYRIEKLRDHSAIFDPSRHARAYWNTILRNFQERDALLQFRLSWPRLTATEIRDHILQSLSQVGNNTYRHAVILLAAVEVMQSMELDIVEPMARELGIAIDRMAGRFDVQIALMRNAAWLASEYNRPEVLRGLLARYLRLLDEVHDLVQIPKMDCLIADMTDTFRRLYLPQEFRQFQSQTYRWAWRPNESKPRHRAVALRTVLPIAGVWHSTKEEETAHHLLAETARLLYSGVLTSFDQTELALRYAQTLGHVSVNTALGRFEEMFQRLTGITVTGTTNTHYTLKPLELIDTVVRADVRQDFTLSPAVRAWLTAEEGSVAARIQRDFDQVRTAQGL